jgi:OMF family outer membrane factor
MMSKRSLIVLAVAVRLAPIGVGAQESAPLTLPEAMALSLERNPRLAAAKAETEQARARVAVAHAAAQPAFKVTGSARLQGPLQEIEIPVGPGRTISFNRTDYATAAFGVVWPLWTGGRIRAATGAARVQLSASEADLQQATEQLLYEVGVGYYRVLIGRRALEEAEAGVTRAEEDVRTAQARRQAGVLTAADLAQAEAGLRRAQQVRAAAGTSVADTEQTLNVLLARPLEASVVLADVRLDLDLPAEADSVEVALVTRPERVALRERQEAARQAIAQAKAERNPTVVAVGQYAVQTATDILPGHQEFVGLEFSWPVLSHPGSRAREREARATVAEVEALRQQLDDAIRLQVEETLRRHADALDSLATAEETLRAAEGTARVAQAAHAAGTATRQQLTATEALRDQARAVRAQAEHAASLALLSRARAMGLVRALFLVAPEEVAPR